LNLGSATVATMSCASTLFPASQIGTCSKLGGSTDRSTRAKVSRSFSSIPNQNADAGKKQMGRSQESGVRGLPVSAGCGFQLE
jgi:hypothetical protein